MALTPREKLSRAKIKMYSKLPYFSYIVEHLTIIEKPTEKTLAIDRYGNFYYNPSFVMKQTDEELVFELAHEAEHLALKHQERGKGRNIILNVISKPEIHKFPESMPSTVKIDYVPRQKHLIVVDEATGITYEEDKDYSIDYKQGIVFLTRESKIPKNKILAFYSKMYYSLWNIAVDLVVNNILLQNCGSHPKQFMSAPKDILLPKDDKFEFAGATIVDISKKSAEELYEDLKKAMHDKQQQQEKKESGEGKGKSEEKDGKEKSSGSSQGSGIPQEITVYVPKEEMDGLDRHDFEKKSDDSGEEERAAKGKSNPVPSKEEKDWDRINNTAFNYAKQRGKIPLGMGRDFEVYNRNYINWYAIMAREIRKSIPQDFTWSKPNRKYISQDLYLPSTYGEIPTVLVSIDTSGSVDPVTLSIFMTGVISLARSFPGVEIRILTHDAAMHDDYLVKNGSIQKIMNLKIHGGGGTSHKPLYKYIEEKKYNKKNNLLFTFTDAASSYPDRPCINTIFILAGYYDKKYVPKWHKGIIEIRS